MNSKLTLATVAMIAAIMAFGIANPAKHPLDFEPFIL
jgi:hypothetical protein